MNDLFNSINNTLYSSLCKLDSSVHDNIKGSTLDNFIHELKAYLIRADVTYRLSKLPEDTLLDINEIEKNYIQCYFNSEEYAIPKDMVYSEDLEGLFNDGYIKLQLQDDGLYHVIRFERQDGITEE